MTDDQLREVIREELSGVNERLDKVDTKLGRLEARTLRLCDQMDHVRSDLDDLKEGFYRTGLGQQVGSA